MANQCSICLSSFKEPVSIPCGHIYCAECLGEHINTATQDGYTSSCPTCRTEFPIVTPERTCLPKQVQKFLFPVIRRVYIPDPSSEIEMLQNALNISQTARRRCEDQVVHLMEQCERYMSASAAHTKGEKDAMLENEKLRRRLALEVEARRKAEEERDREIERAAILTRPPHTLHHGRSLNLGRAPTSKRYHDVSSEEELDLDTDSDGRGTLSRAVSQQRANPTVTFRASTQSTRRPVHSPEESLNQNMAASNRSPIHRPSKRRVSTPSEDFSEEVWSDSDDGLFGYIRMDEGDSDEHENEDEGVIPRATPSVPAPSPLLAITPRRRVMRQLPARPPNKRMRA